MPKSMGCRRVLRETKQSHYLCSVDGQIDFAIGIHGDHAVPDGALIAANFFWRKAICPL